MNMDVSSLRERPDLSPITVSELNERIKRVIESDPSFSRVSVRAEISNFVRHSSGHLYFTLKDADGQIKAVMFRTSAMRLRFLPKDGMKVIVSGSVSVYGRSGAYQLYVDGMQPDGVGALYLAYEQLKNKLSSEGLFDEEYKRSIPRFPKRIGVITSPTGAAVRDIIDVTGRRFPAAEIVLYPSLVQGDGAEEQLIEALRFFEQSRLCDTVIIGRGGGSIEDLWAFNGERLARTIFSMTVPVISAVGHETDFTICDFVADRRAPTPSAAAELATPDTRELLMYLDALPARMRRTLLMKLSRLEEAVRRLSTVTDGSLLLHRLEERHKQLLIKEQHLFGAIDTRLVRAEAALSLLTGKADTLSPLSVLSRGYATVHKDGRLIRQRKDIERGDRVTLGFFDGVAEAQIQSVGEQ